MPVANWARILILVGLVVAAAGVVLLLAARFGGATGWAFGRLPGDVAIRGRRTTVYFPWVSMLVLSAVLTLLVNLFFRLFRR